MTAAATNSSIRFRSLSKTIMMAVTTTAMVFGCGAAGFLFEDSSAVAEAFRDSWSTGRPPMGYVRAPQQHPRQTSTRAFLFPFEDVVSDAPSLLLDHLPQTPATTTTITTTTDGLVPASDGESSPSMAVAHLLAVLVPGDPATAELESEVLLDASHLLLDFSVFVTRSRSVLQAAQVVGRVLLLVQDYLPDRHICPEELAVQVFMIAVCLSKQRTTTNDSGSGSVGVVVDERTSTTTGPLQRSQTSKTTVTATATRSSTKPGNRFRD